MLKKILFFILIFTFNLGYATILNKNYTLIYFKFYPVDLKVKVFTDNRLSSTPADKMEYFISYINNQTGDARIFLVNSSQLERLEGLLTYQYKVVFYKTQKIENESFDVPVYSFKLSFQSDKIKIKYDDLTEKEFLKDMISDTYYIKDEKGNDFNLFEKMRRVKLNGKFRRIGSDKTTNYIDIESNIKVTLIKKEDDEVNFSIDNKFEVPIGREFLIGHYPYEILSSEYEKYISKSLLLKDRSESKSLIIHFGEVWDYPYGYDIVFEKNPYFFEIDFDENLYELYYKIGGNKFKKSNGKLKLALNKIAPLFISNIEVEGISSSNMTKKPFTMQITNITNQTINIKINGLTKALKWLKNPVYNFSFSVTSGEKAKDIAEKIYSSNPERFKIVDEDNALFFKGELKTTPFSIFAYPENAELKIYRIQPKVDFENDTLSFNTSPVFISDFPYGKYSIHTSWFNEDKTLNYNVSNNIVINEDSLKKKNYGIKFLTNRSVRIPYIEILKPEFKKKSKNLYVKNIDLLEKTIEEEKHTTTSAASYFIQLIAFEKNYSKIKRDLYRFTSNYETKYYKKFNEKISFFTAEKRIKGKNYIVLLSGPYTNNEAKLQLSRNLKISKSSFIVSRDELENIAFYNR